MHTDADFLKMLLADPADDTTRLVYADWLEEQGDDVSAAKSEFLRVTAQLATGAGTQRQWKKIEKRLQELAAGLDTDWLAVVSRLAVENCQGKRPKAESRMRFRGGFGYRCGQHWEDLQPTNDGAVRFCDACRQNVHYCDTIIEARKHAEAGHCIALDLGIIRRARDLEPEMMWLGRPSPEMVRAEQERVRPDPVSAERERRKREKRGESRGQTGGLVNNAAPRLPPRPGGLRNRVRVTAGTFAGMEGEVLEIVEARSLVRVELTIFGRSVPVELEFWQVEPVYQGAG